MSTAIDRAAVSRDWRARGFTCDLWVDPPGQVWADFVHDTDELVMLVEGTIEMEFGGRVLCPGIGEEVVIPARTSHTVRNVGGVTSRWLYGYKTLYAQ
jgi:mannose-6-phosphate isomerase-like protein (cupin superfamily)